MIKVSIVLPTYNGARYLRESVDSCLGQTYPNIELIVVVDGSTDETPAVLAEYSDPRLKVIWHEINRGLPEALNTGFACSTGEYLTWTSDDNRFAPEAIEEMLRFLEKNSEVGFVYTDNWFIDDDGRITGEYIAKDPESLWTEPWNYTGVCFLYRRKVYQTIGGYNPDARLAEDYEYFLRIARVFKVAVLHRHLYYYRRHSHSLTGIYGKYGAPQQMLRARLNLGLITPREYRKWTAYLDIDEAFTSYSELDFSRVRKKVVAGILKDPSWLKNRGVLSILAESIIGTSMARSIRQIVRKLS